MAKQKKARGAAKKFASRKRKNPDSGSASLARSSSELSRIFMEQVAPGAVGFLSARIVGKLARVTVGAKVAGGRYQRHFGALGALLALLGAWQLTKRTALGKKYRDPLLIGAGVAAFTTLVQTYLPGLASWFDVAPMLTAARAPAALGAVNGRNGVNGRRRNNKPRIVGVGELQYEEQQQRYAQHGVYDEDELPEEETSRSSDPMASAGSRRAADSRSAAQSVDDDLDQLPGQDYGDGNREVLPAEVAETLQGNEQLSDLYEGVFSN
jgi:hypothetical protein